MTINDPPEGAIFLELTAEKVLKIWNEFNKIRGMFDDYTKGNFEYFLALLRSPNSTWLERTDGNGLLYLTNVRVNLSASAHVVYWDKKLRGRESFTLDCISYMMQVIPLVKLNVYLPDFAHASMAFTKRLGFKQEGCIRRWSHSEGKLFDIHVFGITQEEAINGSMDRPGNGARERILRQQDDDVRPTESGVRHDGDGLVEAVTEQDAVLAGENR